MGKYLTVQQYRLMDEGIPGMATLPDATLAFYVARAESAIDAHVGFDPRLGGFEPRKNVFYQEAFDPHTRRTRLATFPVPIRRITSYAILISNASPGGQPLQATIQPSDCVINEFDGYIEIVPLQAITYSLTPVIAQLGLQPPIIQIQFDAGYYLTSTGTALYDSGDHTTYRSLRGLWATSYTQTLQTQPGVLPPIPPILYVNGTVVASTAYTVNATEGSVTFTVAQGANDSVTADFTYQIPDAIRDATALQVTYLLGQRALNLLGMQGIEMMRSADQQVKRHLRSSASSGPLDEAALHPLAMQLLLPFKGMPLA